MAFGLHSTIFSTLFSNVLVDVCCRMVLNRHASQVSDFFHFPLLSHCFWKYSYVTTYSLLFFGWPGKTATIEHLGRGDLQIEHPYQIIGLECCILLQRELSGNIGAIGNVNFFFIIYIVLWKWVASLWRALFICCLHMTTLGNGCTSLKHNFSNS